MDGVAKELGYLILLIAIVAVPVALWVWAQNRIKKNGRVWK